MAAAPASTSRSGFMQPGWQTEAAPVARFLHNARRVASPPQRVVHIGLQIGRTIGGPRTPCRSLFNWSCSNRPPNPVDVDIDVALHVLVASSPGGRLEDGSERLALPWRQAVAERGQRLAERGRLLLGPRLCCLLARHGWLLSWSDT